MAAAAVAMAVVVAGMPVFVEAILIAVVILIEVMSVTCAQNGSRGSRSESSGSSSGSNSSGRRRRGGGIIEVRSKVAAYRSIE